jgi:4-hydroxy-2-oxoheptanedioate aldolase
METSNPGIDNKNVIALVPCRLGSQRVIDKNTRNFAGESLIKIKLTQLLKVPEISKIVVSTNDPKVIEIANKFNDSKIEIEQREDYYASSDCSNDEFIKYFARKLDFDGHLLFTHVTSPFITEETYSRAIQTYFANLGEHDSLMSVKKIAGYVWNTRKQPVSYSFNQGRWPKTQEIDPVYHINSGIFLIYLPLMKQLGDRVGKNPYYFENDDIETLDIDWLEDFERAEMLWKSLAEVRSIGDLNFRRYLEQKDTVFGVFTKTQDPFIIEILGKAGFDFVILDNEHGPNSPRETHPLVLAAQANGIYPIVRVGSLDAIEIQRTLDLGVAGIQIPQVQSTEDAMKVNKFTKFYPKGQRGLCRFVRPADFSMKPKDSYFTEQNDVINIIHIEGKEGIENLDEILKVEGMDVIFIGPYDLSQSMGIPGQVKDPKLLEEIEKIVLKCKEKGKYVGIFTDDVEMAKKYKQLGVKYIAHSVDVGIFAQAASELIKQLKT